MASLVTVNFCRLDGESLGEGLLNLDHVCMITRNEDNDMTVIHFSVRRTRDEFNQCCYVKETVEEIYKLAGSAGSQIENGTPKDSSAKDSTKAKGKPAPDGTPFYS